MQLSIFRLPLASSKWLCGETVRHEEKIQFNRQSSEFSVDASKSQVEWDTKIQFRDNSFASVANASEGQLLWRFRVESLLERTSELRSPKS